MKLAIVTPLVSPIREPQRGGSQAFVSELARGLVQRGYDVVHNHAFDAPAVGVASTLSVLVVHTIHLPPDAAVAGTIRQAVRRSPPPVVACVSVSHANAWRRIVPVDAVLPPYIPTRQIDFSLTAGSGAVFAGRLSPEKGAADAIAIARLAGVEIDLFGDSYDVEYARDQIDSRRDERGVAVHTAVPQTKLWEAMARAAVVLCPAKWEEPFGMVAAEAQACGTPVVAFRRGALPEVIVDGTTGFLVEPGDDQAAAEAVSRASALSRRACREHAEGQLDIERSLDAHERLYERVASADLGARTGV